MDTKDQRDLFFGALIGSAVGAAAALFLTPMSGERLRGRIQNFWNGSSKKVVRSLSHLPGLDTLKKAPRRAVSRVKAATTHAKTITKKKSSNAHPSKTRGTTTQGHA